MAAASPDKAALSAAFRIRFGATAQTPSSPAETAINDFCDDLADDIDTFLKSGEAGFTQVIADLFAGAVPVVNDGGAAILAKFISNAASYDNKAKYV